MFVCLSISVFMFACIVLCCITDRSPYHPHRPFGWAQTARRPRWNRTCWPNTLGTGTFARLANRKLGNGGSAVWLPCWSAAMLQCLLSTVGEWGHEKVQPSAIQPHQWANVWSFHYSTEINCGRHWWKLMASGEATHTFSMTYHSGARPRGLGGFQLSTTYDLKISDACTSVGSPGTVT